MKKVLSLALALTLCLGLTTPASAYGLARAADPTPVQDTAALAIETLEAFAARQSAAQLKGYFYLDFDKDGVAELVMVYKSDWGDEGEWILVGRYDNGSVQKVTGYPDDEFGGFFSDELRSSFGGSGGTAASILRFQDGTCGFESKTFGTMRDSDGLRGRYSQGKIASTKDKGTEIYALAPWNALPGKFDLYTKPAAPVPIAYASTQSVNVDGKAVEFEMYALKNEAGNMTNYVKLRDLAAILNGTQAQFAVGWNGAVNIETGKEYAPDGTEMKTPYSGDRAYQEPTAPTNINGAAAEKLAAIVLTDDAGNGYTYYQLRDLGEALGFNVGWSAEKGVFVETDKPYSSAD